MGFCLAFASAQTQLREVDAAGYCVREKRKPVGALGPAGVQRTIELGWVQDFAFFAAMAAQPQFGI
jgi:hypothetical protein